MIKRTAYPKEVAEALNVSVDTVGRYARESLIPFDVTPKGHRRYDIDEVRAVLASRTDTGEFSGLRSASVPVRTGLVAGPATTRSDAAALRESIRATRTYVGAVADSDLNEPAVLDDLIKRSPRILASKG